MNKTLKCDDGEVHASGKSVHEIEKSTRSLRNNHCNQNMSQRRFQMWSGDSGYGYSIRMLKESKATKVHDDRL